MLSWGEKSRRRAADGFFYQPNYLTTYSYEKTYFFRIRTSKRMQFQL